MVFLEHSDERAIFLLKIGQGVMVALAVVAAFSSVKFHGKLLYMGIALSLICAWIATRFYAKTLLYKKQLEIRHNWGNEVQRPRDFSFISDLFNVRKEHEDTFFIDDRTWQDLDMDAIYGKIDRCQTLPGQQYLYYLLRKPEMELAELTRRNSLIKSFETDKSMRESMQIILNRMGTKGGEGIVSFLWNKLPSTKSIWFYRALVVLMYASFVCTAFNPGVFMITVLPVLALNMYFHYHEKKKIFDYLGALFYLGRFLAGARRIVKWPTAHPEIRRYQQELREALRPVKKLTGKTAVFMLKNDPITEYFFIVFLTEVRTFYKVIEIIARHQTELRKIYQTIAELDAFLSVASYRTGLAYYSEPKLSSLRENALHGDRVIAEGLFHPLLKNPVSNSFTLTRSGALITGSNMSGKSTLLRAVGVNALLSQTIFTSLSNTYCANFYKILTSIGRSDNVITGDSYYLVEAKALRRIIEELSLEVPILCIVDEIFRGTNSLERIAASAEVLHYLAQANCLLFAATHDLELTELLVEKLHNFHFKENIDDKGLSFDYHLWPGPSTTRNAINLLEYLGYPASIIEGAREIIAKTQQKSDQVWGTGKFS